MKKTEYAEANNNFRHFVSLEQEYLKLFVNSTTFIFAAYWLICEINFLRYGVSVVSIFLSAGVLITELRYSQYFKHFMKISEMIENENDGMQFSSMSKHLSRPFLGIRSTNVIISFYVSMLFFWIFIFIVDVSGADWFASILSQIHSGKIN